MGEEIGSPGLGAVIADHRDLLAADLLLASDGPRLSAETPTIFLGARGGRTFRLHLKRRDGRAAFGEFRRAPEKPGAGNGPCAHHDIRARGRGAGPRLDSGRGRPGLTRAPRGRHPRRRRDRRGLGHARPDPGGAGLCLVLGRNPRLHLRRPRPPGQRDPARGHGLGAAAPCHGAGPETARRHLRAHLAAHGLRRYRGDRGWRGLPRHRHAARSSRRGVRGGLGRTDHRQSARHPAVAGRLAAQ
jgi:hypothetical protein